LGEWKSFLGRSFGTEEHASWLKARAWQVAGHFHPRGVSDAFDMTEEGAVRMKYRRTTKTTAAGSINAFERTRLGGRCAFRRRRSPRSLAVMSHIVGKLQLSLLHVLA
jgi:hypothetical protein